MKEFFVMCNTRFNHIVIPLLEEDEFGNDVLMQFETLEQALESTKECPIAQTYGFEVFRIGNGEC